MVPRGIESAAPTATRDRPESTKLGGCGALAGSCGGGAVLFLATGRYLSRSGGGGLRSRTGTLSAKTPAAEGSQPKPAM